MTRHSALHVSVHVTCATLAIVDAVRGSSISMDADHITHEHGDMSLRHIQHPFRTSLGP